MKPNSIPNLKEISFPPIFTFHYQEKEQAWFLQTSESHFRFYSKRSLVREAKNIYGYYSKLSFEKTLIIIAPFIEKLRQQLFDFFLEQDLEKKIIWLSSFTNYNKLNYEENNFFKNYCQLIKNENQWREFLFNLKGNEKFEIFVHPLLIKKINFPYSDWLITQLQEGALRLKTIFHFEKTWQKNFQQNYSIWQTATDISLLPQPDILLLAGSSADRFFKSKKSYKQKVIWVADTCAGVCLEHNIIPNVVFSLDGGISTYEHFNFEKFATEYQKVFLLIDLLSLPQLLHKNFKKIFSYGSNYPQWQKLQQEKNLPQKFSYVENIQGNVGGIMLAILDLFFKNSKPDIWGYDKGHRHYATHLRGSAYHKKQYREMNRFKTCEQYFYQLSKSYYPNN